MHTIDSFNVMSKDRNQAWIMAFEAWAERHPDVVNHHDMIERNNRALNCCLPIKINGSTWQTAEEWKDSGMIDYWDSFYEFCNYHDYHEIDVISDVLWTTDPYLVFKEFMESAKLNWMVKYHSDYIQREQMFPLVILGKAPLEAIDLFTELMIDNIGGLSLEIQKERASVIISNRRFWLEPFMVKNLADKLVSVEVKQ